MIKKDITCFSIYVMGQNIKSYEDMAKVLEIGFNKVRIASNTIFFICDDVLINVKEGKGFTIFSVTSTAAEHDTFDKLLKIANNHLSFAVYHHFDDIVDMVITDHKDYEKFVGVQVLNMVQEQFTASEMAQCISYMYRKTKILKNQN